MGIAFFFGYIGLCLLFYSVFEGLYPDVKLRVICTLAICWPVAIAVIAVNEIVDYMTSSSED
jgi:hypothetical protein